MRSAMWVGGGITGMGEIPILGIKEKGIAKVIRDIFRNSEQGFFYDPFDMKTMFQDSFGITAVTAPGQPVGLILDKSKGLVLGQNIATSRNVIGTGVGGLTFKTVSVATTAKVGTRYKVSYRVSNYTGTGNVGFVGAAFSSPLNAATALSGNGIVSFIAEAQSTSLHLYTRDTNNADFLDVSIQELIGNHAYQTTSASRPILRQNASTGAYYLEFDGSDDFLVTNSIDFTATDKVSLFAGVQKLSDKSSGAVAELSESTMNSNGSFGLFAPNVGSDVTSFLKGSGSRSTSALDGYAAPASVLVTAKFDISGNNKQHLKVNSAVRTSTNSVGTGYFGNYPLFIGRRGGTIYPLKGDLYSLIGIGRLTTDSETAAIEKELSKRVGVTLNV